MASSLLKSSNRTSTPLPPKPGTVLIAFDATKNRDVMDFKHIIKNVLTWGTMIQEVDNIKVLGVLHKVLHPMGFQIQIGPDSFVGAHRRAIKEEVTRKVDAYVDMLQHSYELCEADGIDLEVKVAVGAPMNKVVVQEVVDLNASWAILDRRLRKELRFYLDHIPCRVAHVRDDLTLHVFGPYNIRKSNCSMKHKLLYSMSKPISPPPTDQENESEQQSVISIPPSTPTSSDIAKNESMMPSTSQHEEDKDVLEDEYGSDPEEEISGSRNELENKQDNSEEYAFSPESPTEMRQDQVHCGDSDTQTTPDELPSDLTTEVEVKRTLQIHSDTLPVFPTSDDKKIGFDSLGCSFSIIRTATDNFSSDNLLGGGGNVVVYKGRMKDGQFVVVKVQKKEVNKEGFEELRSEVNSISFVRHTNVVTLLGYCCDGGFNMLIYEYICNKSLEWHLFDNRERVLEWHRRQAIAIGAAKGLRFLHEECRGSPIVHRDIRPSNILITHDYVPMLGDFGLAKWKVNEGEEETRILGTLGYLAPEYAETGTRSVKTDVYAFGIVLLQLISGRKAEDLTKDNQQQSIKDWAFPLIHSLALHELVDPRLGDLYSTYEVYNMARAANLCLRSKPATRPTMGEVLCLLEGANNHLRHVNSNLYPMISHIS